MKLKYATLFRMTKLDGMYIPMSNWAVQLCDEILPPISLQIGERYIHPDDGVIEITGGCYRDASFNRVSNFWNWTIVETGEQKCGYGAQWPKALDDEWR